MSSLSPHIFGQVHVTWNENGTANTIAYRSMSLEDAVGRYLRSADFQGLHDLLEDLLNAVGALQGESKRKVYLADRIFEYLAIDTVPPNPKFQVQLWNELIRHVWEWEDSHEKVHKGTAYFWAAASYLSLGDVSSAYVFFFNALEDAKRNFPSIPKNLADAPSYRTTSLVDNKNNALYTSVVVPLRNYLQSFINSYNSRTKAHLDLHTLDRKFLQDSELEDIKRLFVATLHEVYHLSPLNSSRMISNDFSKLKAINTFFNFGLIIDQILEHRFLQDISEKDRTMGKAVFQLALHSGLEIYERSPNHRDFFKRVYPDLRDPPDVVLPVLLQGVATYDGFPLDNKTHAVLIAYHLRNYGGHHLKGNNVLIERYEAILNRIMDALFAAIESL